MMQNIFWTVSAWLTSASLSYRRTDGRTDGQTN